MYLHEAFVVLVSFLQAYVYLHFPCHQAFRGATCGTASERFPGATFQGNSYYANENYNESLIG